MNKTYLELAIEVAQEAGKILCEEMEHAPTIAYKGDFDLVTQADRRSEAFIVGRLQKYFPEHAVAAEEGTGKDTASEYRWHVDPLDGTREFVLGLPEFCVSVGFVESGKPVAGGIYNPATNQNFLGAIDAGVLYNGRPSAPSQRTSLAGALVLASRSEVKRGEWKQFESAEFKIRPMGSVAYKLGLVSAGLADLTFTLVPKNEWDVAAGAALVESAGGWTLKLDHSPFCCNQKNPLISGLLAGGPFLKDPLRALLDRHSQTVAEQRR